MKRKILIPLLLFLIFPLIAIGKTENKFYRFLEHLKAVNTLKISFAQITELDSEIGEKDFYSGVIEYKRPKKFLWKYTKNSQMEIVSNGKTVWTCIPEDKKLKKSKIDDALDYLPVIRILESPESFDNYFEIISNAKIKDKTAFELLPKKKNLGYKKVIVIFKEKTEHPISFQIINRDGSSLTYIVENWKENDKLPDTIFKVKRCQTKETE